MPNLPITQLPSASALQPTNVFPVVQGGITKQSTFSQIIYAPGNNYGLFNQTGSSVVITNTTTETSLLDGGIGTLSVPANGFTTGDAYHAILTGTLSAQNNTILEIRVKSNGALLADTGAISMAGTTNKNWKMEIYFSINAIGAAGIANISTGGTFMYTKDASLSFEGTNFSTQNSSTFDTTINNTLVITAQWGTANPGNSIYSQIFTLNKTF